jgi:hypothetical protein
MKVFGLSLFLLNLFAVMLFLPVGALSSSEVLAERRANFHVYSIQEQRFALLQQLVLVAYQDQFGSKSASAFPPHLLLTHILGTDGAFYSNGCSCYGVTHWSDASDIAVVVVEETGPYSQDWVLAHELTHVLQAIENRWSAESRGAFEREADFVAQTVMAQMKMLGAPAVWSLDR